MGDVGVPVEAEDLTPEWLSGALAEGGLPGAVVSDVSATRIGEGVGFIGQIHRLELTYESQPDGAPESVIAKMPTSDPGGRMIGTMMRLYGQVAELLETRDRVDRIPEEQEDWDAPQTVDGAASQDNRSNKSTKAQRKR